MVIPIESDNKNVGVNPKNVGVNPKSVGVKTAENILSLIKDNDKITIAEMAEKLNKTQRTIERSIYKLKQNNILQRIGSDKNGSWKIVYDIIK